uniref:UPF0415 protein C7orf25 isogeny n=1 Tax=Cajanus cajan TaxID=3821 RepID=A0A151T3S9_CAJCA|nr:UPF0415 protein C7orf25 isogeny [Cajanus cajan]
MEEQRVAQVELAKQRCKCVIDSIDKLPCSTNITHSCRRTLLKLARAELAFLSRPSSSSSAPLSVNIGHLETVVHILQQPFITGVSRVCNKGLKQRIQEVLAAAQSNLTLRPSSVILFFANGLATNIYNKLQDEFGASEIGLDFSVFSSDVLEETEVDEAKTQTQPTKENVRTNLGDTFCSILMGIKPSSTENKMSESASGNLFGETDLVNFDTTALIALVSGISNGGTEQLLATPESEMRQRFKGNFDFVIGQIMSEIQNPIHTEFGRFLQGKTGLICDSVLMEFKELVSMCGGPSEKLRAVRLINCLRVVPDTPSERMMGLPTTRKLALKNKVVFGTGDHWHAPTLTANMAFVRAVSQTGMSLSTIEHRPRALTGD